ncbi:hypothetical protein LR48_Vigan09g142200 [Vigna angularis]|uniref:Uncharacterized protein n=1 Tax=Phaseolus angularis TaxID=3914 RepID=A0A0L9VCM7_PHAAN|nr:hypothetical protein LR48_Vigan09g142200 [Vigna angularis]
MSFNAEEGVCISLDKFILEADGLETLHLKDCALEFFELVGKGALKHFKIDDVSVIHLDIGDTVEDLETVHISKFTIIWPKFYQMISRSSKSNGVVSEAKSYEECQMLASFTTAGVGHDEEIHKCRSTF